jgi:lipopolysaccharide export system permease protein
MALPILWRYLLAQYLKVLCLCTFSFVAILLTTRLDDIAHFASLGSQGLIILQFTLYQIPYILPIALPISCLISTVILIQRLSSTHELTAMRASGLPLKDILAPILLAAAILSIFNFYVVSELATKSHLETSLLKNELRSVNPLLLLHNKHLMKLKGFYFDTTGASRMGETASDVILAMPNKKNQSINVILGVN